MCEHNKTLSELSQVKWKIGEQICAVMNILSGIIEERSYNDECGFESRATNFSSTSLTLSEMKSYDDGEFICTTTSDDGFVIIDVTRFNVIVKGKEGIMHQLMLIMLFCNYFFNYDYAY